MLLEAVQMGGWEFRSKQDYTLQCLAQYSTTTQAAVYTGHVLNLKPDTRDSFILTPRIRDSSYSSSSGLTHYSTANTLSNG